MKIIMQIIEKRGGFSAIQKAGQIKIKNGDYMPLVIESVGTGPRNLPLLSVAHYYDQNGDLMADPEMTFELGTDGQLYPVSYQQDSLGLYQVAVEKMEDGRVGVRPRMQRELAAFARTWNKNLREQGFVAAA